MLPAALATQSVTRLRGTAGADGYDDPVTDWATPAELDIPGCSFQPEPGTEVLTDRAAVISRWRWFGPPDADVKASDRLRVDGIVYDVDGSVQAWKGLGLDHLTCLCRRTDG